MPKILTVSVAFMLTLLTAQRGFGSGVQEARTAATHLKSLQCQLRDMGILGQQMPTRSKEREQLADKWDATAELMEKERDRLNAMIKTLNDSEMQEIQIILFSTCEGKPPSALPINKCEGGAKYQFVNGALTCK